MPSDVESRCLEFCRIQIRVCWASAMTPNRQRPTPAAQNSIKLRRLSVRQVAKLSFAVVVVLRMSYAFLFTSHPLPWQCISAKTHEVRYAVAGYLKTVLNCSCHELKPSILLQPNNPIQHKVISLRIRIQAKVPRPHSLKSHRLRTSLLLLHPPLILPPG
jgi:hypothetical protein